MPHLGTVTVDVAYGGMFYVIADAAQFGLRLTPDEGRDIVRIGEMIKAAAREQCPVVHPEQPGFDGVTIAQLSGPPLRNDADWQNAVVVSTGSSTGTSRRTWTGAIDRSPCGTGTCAKMAALHAKGKLRLNQDFRHAGVLGTVFTGRLVEETRVGRNTARRRSRRSAARRGSPGWRPMSSIRTIRFRRGSPSATSGRRAAAPLGLSRPTRDALRARRHALERGPPMTLPTEPIGASHGLPSSSRE